MKIKVGGVLDVSTLDYPGKVSTVIYLSGCSFRCPWCHNPELVEGNEYREIEIEKLVSEIKKNFLINSVAITGGEPLLQKEIIELLRNLREKTNFNIKIDTNCSFPENLEKALPYLDFISTDIKAPFEKYSLLIGINSDKILENVKRSHELLKSWNKPKEARTTIVTTMNDSLDDIEKIAEIVKRVGFTRFVLQQFRPLRTLDAALSKCEVPTYEKMKGLGETAKKILPNVEVVITTDKGGIEVINKLHEIPRQSSFS